MRSVIAAAAFAAVLFAAAAAQADKRIFIIANNADGYGIDRCLASGESCGKAAANSLLPGARVRAGAVVPKGRPRRHDGDHSRRLPRHRLRRLRRHRVLALTFRHF